MPINPITIVATPATAVATSGTVTFNYPSGYNAASFVTGGATMYSEGLETLFTEGASNFSVVYGASSATVTYLGSTTIPAGTALRFGPSVAPTVGVTTLTFPFRLAGVAGNGDLVTNYVPGYAFRILSVDFAVTEVVTTASRRADFNLEIGTTNLTGGVVSVTSAAATPVGTVIAGTAVTAANVGTATDSISIESSNVTAHAEGAGVLLVKIQNLDTANEVASR